MDFCTSKKVKHITLVNFVVYYLLSIQKNIRTQCSNANKQSFSTVWIACYNCNFSYTGLPWFKKILNLTLPEPRDININPKNCIGTVLSLNGHRRYFCMYHAKHPEGSRRKVYTANNGAAGNSSKLSVIFTYIQKNMYFKISLPKLTFSFAL